jgi:hypothetical protein
VAEVGGKLKLRVFPQEKTFWTALAIAGIFLALYVAP